MLTTKEKEISQFNSVFEIFELTALKYPDYPAITDAYTKVNLTYSQVIQNIKNLSSGLQSLGLKKNEHVSLFSESNGKWLIADQAILRCGAIDAVRGSNAPVEELNYILGQSDSKAVILRDKKLLNSMKTYLNEHALKFIVLMFKDKTDVFEGYNAPIYSMEEIIELGKKNIFDAPEILPEDDATLIYTSGTTGNPKGAIITHSNFISQIRNLDPFLCSKAGEITMQILPVWHAYERIGQYYYFAKGCNLCFTTLSGLRNDLKKYHVAEMMSVPRIWESIRNGIYMNFNQKSKMLAKIFDFAIKMSIKYKKSKMYLEKRITNQRKYTLIANIKNLIATIILYPVHKFFENLFYTKIREEVGLNLKMSISGGGALKEQEELFYDAIGVNLRVGYGLTETSPVLAIRALNDKNYLGAAGTPLAETQIKIVDLKTKEELKPFEKGLVMAKGPQIMKGYYKNEEATKQMIDDNGWLNTGDLGWFTNEGNLVLVGRIKETIVLSSGENVEPIPIEEACLNSEFIEQIVLVGQDQSSIGALIVPSKNAVEKCGLSTNSIKDDGNTTIKNKHLRELIKNEIQDKIKSKPHLKTFEKIMKFEILKDDFSVSNGLMTPTSKVKRNKVFKKYGKIIDQMYSK